MMKPIMRWRDRQTLFSQVTLPGNILSGRLFAIGSCFAENVVGVLKARGTDARLAASGLYYTPATVAAYLEALAADKPEIAIFGAGDKCYSPQLESRNVGSASLLRARYESQWQEDRAFLALVDNVVVTLGLNEQLLIEANGVSHLCRQLPPPALIDHLSGEVALRLWSVADIKLSLAEIVASIRKINPRANVVFTVSPVPLHASFQALDVRVANMASKASLHAGLQEFLGDNPGFFYFPSFEHAQILQADGNFFEDDERHVSRQGVEVLMGLLAAYAGEGGAVSNTRPRPAGSDIKRSVKKTIRRGLSGLGLVR